MIAPSPDLIHQLPCSTTRATDAASTRRPISRRGPGYCKPMPLADTTSSIAKAATLVPCSRLAALPMRAASSSSLPMS